MTVWPKLIMFDLDGTLIDSVPDIALAINELVALDNHAPFSVDQVRSMVGQGVAKLVQKAYLARGVSLTAEMLDEKLRTMDVVYMRHLTGNTTVLSGAREALTPHAGRQYVLVTNKLQAATEVIVDHFGWRNAFAMVLGDSGIPLKPSPDMLLHVARSLGVAAKDVVMVGDSVSDITSARNAGIVSVLVEGGYSDIAPSEMGADIVIPNLLALNEALATYRRA